MSVNADGRVVGDRRNAADKGRTHLLIGAAFLLADASAAVTPASAQTSVPLPPVTVEQPTQKRKPAANSARSAQRTQAAAAARQRSAQPTTPTPSERAAAAAAALNEAKLHYRAMPSSTTLRSGASPLDTAQTVNVVPEQVLRDQLPRNLDDALANVSGVTQGNTLAGTQDAVMRRGFGDNRDGSIMRNGMPLVQGRSLNAAVESV
ncbi:MAG: TonB-dependent receptor plug domain-containing protein, partial [Bradyrhizobium sp.]